MEIRNLQVNALSQLVRAGLKEALWRLSADESLHGGVFLAGGGTFIAGAEIKEVGKPPEALPLPDVFAAVKACPKPVMAALHAATQGGVLELALAWDACAAQAGTLLGLPEVMLGLIAGTGGTQALPRIAGVSAAIQLIGTGERLSADVARDCGVVDEVVAVAP